LKETVLKENSSTIKSLRLVKAVKRP